ncbi:MAG TPA: ABC transporter ATP-binding protein [bacterium]|nr:ABC transporter ATP-binding protein [bacterium]
MTAAVTCRGIGHSYGDRTALGSVDLEVPGSGLFALLGPNGGGKSTLFRILATQLRPDRGSAEVLGHDVVREARAVRRSLGVAFQSPSLDARLGVRENLMHQGHLHGLRGRELSARIGEMLDRFRLADRAGDRANTLSGGLARRVDLARALLHRPQILLLDEPSTGLDPTARRELMETLAELRDERGTTVLLTTHLTDEAARCDRVALLDRGTLVAEGAPDELVNGIGGDVVTLAAEDAPALAAVVREKFGGDVTVEGDHVRTESARGAELLPQLLGAFGDRVRSATVSRPSLEDVFLHRTGRAWNPEDDGA